MKWQMSILSVKNFPSYLIKWCLFEVFLLFPHVMPLTSYHCRMPFCSCLFFFAKMMCMTAPHGKYSVLQSYCIHFAKLLRTNLNVPRQPCLFLVSKFNYFILFFHSSLKQLMVTGRKLSMTWLLDSRSSTSGGLHTALHSTNLYSSCVGHRSSSGRWITLAF